MTWKRSTVFIFMFLKYIDLFNEVLANIQVAWFKSFIQLYEVT